MVTCEICGWVWDERDTVNVRWLNIDRAWTCTDEAECFGRRAATEHLQPGRLG
jgi:rubredoxin